MACLPAAPPARALRRWLGLGLFVLLCLHLGYALEKKVKSKLGEKVGLPCCHEIESSDSLHNYRVYWQKNTMEVVLAYAEGKEISKDKRYMNRTEMDDRNFTLWISPVEILDNGPYQCVVQHLRSSQNPSVVCDETVTLFVTEATPGTENSPFPPPAQHAPLDASLLGKDLSQETSPADFSKPNITANVSGNSCESTEMVVRCSSYGGFPKPEITGTLNNESVVWNVSWVSESSLSPYSVTGILHLNVTKDVSFTCSVGSNGFTKSTSLLLKKTNDCVVPTVPPSYNVITASSIIIIIFLLAITLAARYLSRHVCSRCCKPQDSVEEGVKECTKTPMNVRRHPSETSSV